MTAAHLDHDREQRLQEVLLAYLEGIEAGQQPDRQHFLGGHSDLAVELSEFFAQQDKLKRLAEPLRRVAIAARGEAATPLPQQTVPEPTDSPPVAGRSFGNFEVLDEIGRGGMGTVYRAQQKNLNRQVALKMVRVASLACEADVQRFRNEAETVATLDHQHIVPVYEQADDLYAKLTHDFHSQPAYEQGQALTQISYGMLMFQSGRPDEAEKAWPAAAGTFAKLVGWFPGDPANRVQISRENSSLSVLLPATGRA
jgi:hypothetical protein